MVMILATEGLSKRFGGFVALDGIDLDVQQGERLGLIGPNGSGKSTLVNCVCGTLHNETGSVHFAGHLLDVNDLIAVVDTVLRCRGTVPSVAVIPRPPA